MPQPQAPTDDYAPAHWVDHGALRRDAPPVPPGSWLADVQALAEVMFATHHGPPPEDRIRWLCAELDDFATQTSAKTRLLIRTAVATVSRLAPAFVLSPGPFRRLPLAKRALALERYERSPLGMSLFAVNAIFSILWLEHPETARELGFDGRCLGATPNRWPAP